MKKIVKFLAIFLIFLSCLTSQNINSASAANLKSKLEFESEINQIFNNIHDNYNHRVAGTENEYQFSVYIHQLFSSISGLTAVNNSTTQNGYQNFKFNSTFSNGYENSQNIIFEKKSTTKNAKKIIIGSNYDSYVSAYDELTGDFIFTTDNEGINCSGGSIVLLFELAKYCSNFQYDFDIEFIAFGAGECDYSGAKFFTSGLDDADKSEIICYIDLARISVGESLYFYVDETSNDLSKFLDNLSYKESTDISEIQLTHLIKNHNIQSSSVLPYTHIALNSENSVFKSNGINTISFFAGDYNTGLISGYQEFDGIESINNTTKDNLSYIQENYGASHVTDNLYSVYKMLTSMISSEEFINLSENSSTFVLFKSFNKNNLILYLTCVIFIIYVVISIIIHYNLTLKSYSKDVEDQFVKSVMQITDQIDSDGKNQNIPKVISQVIANDIKKDKTVKPSKKDKKKDS